MAVTRSKSAEVVTAMGSSATYPQLIPMKSGLSLAAGSDEGMSAFQKAMKIDQTEFTAEKEFLAAFGTVSNLVSDEVVLSPAMAEAMSCALSHKVIDEEGLTDPYFTEQEWEKVSKSRLALIEEAEKLFCADFADFESETITNWKQKAIEIKKPVCQCFAHRDNTTFEILQDLFFIEKPLDDDTGHDLAQTLVTVILKAAGLDNMQYKATSQGARTKINYVLQLPSGKTSIFTGYPDYLVIEKFNAIARREGRLILRRQNVRGVGDVQSPRSKNMAYAQAGIYTVGQLAKLQPETVLPKIATILLYKDITAQVAIACLNTSKITENGSLGEVSYKTVGSVSPYNLQDQEELSNFADTLVATLRTCTK